MKILQVHNLYRDPGGEDGVVDREAALLRSAGHDVVQFQVSNPAATLPTVGKMLLSSWNPSAARRMTRIVDDQRPDVVHVHNTWFSLTSSVLPAMRELNVPVVMTLHNYRFTCSNGLLLRDGKPCELCVDSHPWHGVRYRCYRGSVPASAAAATAIAVNRRSGAWEKSVDRFLCFNEFNRSRFLAAGLPAEKIRIKPNFVDDPGPRPAPPSASNTVLFVGRLSAEKGADVLVDAWERNPPPGLELRVVGDGPLRRELEARSVPGVVFFGWLPQPAVSHLMLSSRALCFPSRWYEGQPMVITEAFASGLPVLASRLGSMAAMMAGMDAWLIDVADPGAWIGALHSLSDGDVDAAGSSVRSRFEREYSPQRALAILAEVYAEVAHTD